MLSGTSLAKLLQGGGCGGHLGGSRGSTLGICGTHRAVYSREVFITMTRCFGCFVQLVSSSSNWQNLVELLTAKKKFSLSVEISSVEHHFLKLGAERTNK